MLFTLCFGISTAPQGVFAQLQQAKPWLGVAIDQGKSGVLVKEVLKGTPAETYGLAAGDEITAIDNLKVAVPPELIKAVQSRGIGNKVVVHFVRAGKPTSKEVELVAKPDELELLKNQLVGKPAPSFDLKVITGNAPGSNAKLRGKPAIIEFWATWCPACVGSHKRLSEFAKANAGKIAVLAVTDEDDQAIARYLSGKSFDFTIVKDTDQKMQAAYKVSAIPQLVLIDKDGKVVDATIGGGFYLDEFLASAAKQF